MSVYSATTGSNFITKAEHEFIDLGSPDDSLRWSDFRLTRAEIQLQIAETTERRAGWFKHPNTTYWVIRSSRSEEFPRLPLSRHTSFSEAVEHMLLIHESIALDRPADE